jgi:hypothetical protein
MHKSKKSIRNIFNKFNKVVKTGIQNKSEKRSKN